MPLRCLLLAMVIFPHAAVGFEFRENLIPEHQNCLSVTCRGTCWGPVLKRRFRFTESWGGLEWTFCISSKLSGLYWSTKHTLSRKRRGPPEWRKEERVGQHPWVCLVCPRCTAAGSCARTQYGHRHACVPTCLLGHAQTLSYPLCPPVGGHAHHRVFTNGFYSLSS